MLFEVSEIWGIENLNLRIRFLEDKLFIYLFTVWETELNKKGGWVTALKRLDTACVFEGSCPPPRQSSLPARHFGGIENIAANPADFFGA